MITPHETAKLTKQETEQLIQRELDILKIEYQVLKQNLETTKSVSDALQNNNELNLTRLIKERDAWIDTARQHATNEQFYRNILVDIGTMLGPEVYKSDDGTIQDEPLILKIKELIKPLTRRSSNIAWCTKDGQYIDPNPEIPCQNDSPKPEATSEPKQPSPTNAPNQDTNNK